MAQVLLKGKPVNTTGNLPKMGSKAPNFELVDADLKVKQLSDFAGKKKVLSFVPSLDTPTCSLSAKKFNEAANNFKNTVVLVISADLPFAQKRFCGAENLKNVMTLSLMRSKKSAEDYGVLLSDGPLTGLCTRAIVVLDESDNVIYTELVAEITQEPNYDPVIKLLRDCL